MKKLTSLFLAVVASVATLMASMPTSISEYTQEGITKGQAMSIPMTYLAFQVGCSSSSYIGVDMYAPSGKNYTIIGTSYTNWGPDSFQKYQYFNPVSWCYSITTVASGYAFFDLQSVESGVWTLRSIQKYAGEWYYIPAEEENNEEPIVINATISQDCNLNGINESHATQNSLNGHSFVDLGLPSGLLWATCNVGASAPEQIGDYYAWGETQTKSNYSLSTYQYASNAISLSDISGTQYDAARVNWGGEWRMPSRNEVAELTSNCSRKDTTINGQSGLLLRGANGNYIFIPCAGHWCNSEVMELTGKGFWTSTATGSRYAYRAWEWTYISFSEREQGFQIRPVISGGASLSTQTHTLTLYADGCENPNVYVFDEGQQVSISAIPQENNQFVQWSDGNTDNPRQVSLDANITLTALFEDTTAVNPSLEEAVIYQDCNQNGINAALAENLSLQSISANVNGHAYVDLGLPSGNLWATCNLGAQDSTGIGDYYAWGELTTKTSYTNATYQYQDWYGTKAYVYLGDEISGTQYDVAKHIYGGDWRFPTAEEAREILTYCTKVAHDNGNEYVGPNGKSIFIPKSGYRQWESVLSSFAPLFWTGTYKPGDDPNYQEANSYAFYGDQGKVQGMCRRFGLPVRPVCSNTSSEPSNNFTLTLFAEGCTTPNTYICASDQEVTINAVSQESNVFKQWSDGNTENPRTIVIFQDTTFIAIFEPIRMATDLDMIYINGNPIDGFAPDQYTYTFRYPSTTAEETLPTLTDITWNLGDEYQTVTATQAGNTIVLTVISGRGLVTTYVLSFVIERPNQYTVTTLSNNDAWGMAIGGNVYNANVNVSIGAFANDGYQFYHWNNTITANPYTFQLTQDTSFVATFLPNTEEEIITDVTSNSVHMEWEVKPWGNHGYWVWIYLDKDHKQWYCKMRFYADGSLSKFYWGPASKHYDGSEPDQAPLRYIAKSPASYLTAPSVISYDLEYIDEGTQYFYTIEDVDENENVISIIAGTFNTPAITTDIENTSSSLQGEDRGRLILRDGQIFILRGDKVYTLQGQKIK